MAGLSCSLGNAEDPAKGKSTNVGDLKGKIVALTLMSDSEDLVLLSEVSEKQIGGKSFLCGDGVNDGETPDWRNGAVVYIPIDDIQQLVAFADLKAYKKNLDARQNRVEGKAASLRTRPGPRT
jgi:uncharacterized protein (DUF1330 family)